MTSAPQVLKHCSPRGGANVFVVFVWFLFSVCDIGAAQTAQQTRMLPTSVDRIYPAGADAVVAVTLESGEIQLIDVSTGNVRAFHSLGGAVRSVDPFQGPSSFEFAIVFDPPGGSPKLDVLKTEEGILKGKLSESVPPEFLRPVAQAFDGQRLVLWERELDSNQVFYRVIEHDATRDVSWKSAPSFDLLSVRNDGFVLTLDPRNEEASILDVENGLAEDSVYVNGLAVKNPAHLTAFAPGAPYGGMGDAVVANGETKILTVLSVRDTSVASPRLRIPLQAPLKQLASVEQGHQELLVAADRGLSFILVGAVDSDRLGVFRSIGGGLEMVESSVRLDFPIRDVTVTHGPGGSDPETFVFLHANGREILFVPDVSKLLGQPKSPTIEDSDEPLKPDVIAFTRTDFSPGEFARVQRVLGALGHQVGNIDGVPGRQTEAAIRDFQFQNGLPVSGEIDERTLGALNQAVGKIGRTGEWESYAEDYQAFVARSVQGVDATRLLTLGVSHENPSSSCFGSNSLPPKNLWANSLDFARILSHLKQDAGLDVQVISGYRNAAYNRCIKGHPESSHLSFQGFDMRLSAANGDTSALMSALRRFHEARQFVGSYRVLREGSSTVHVNTTGLVVTERQIKSVFPKASDAIVQGIINNQSVLREEGIMNNGTRFANFLAFIATDTAGLSRLDENMNYSERRLQQVFSRKSISEEKAREIAHKPKATANWVYGGRLGNLGRDTDDGWNYRGRGFLQITGRAKYRQVGREIGIDLEGAPHLMSEPGVALKVAARIWSKRKLNELVDEGDGALHNISRKLIGPSGLGLRQTTEWFRRAARLWAPAELDIGGSKGRKLTSGMARP